MPPRAIRTEPVRGDPDGQDRAGDEPDREHQDRPQPAHEVDPDEVLKASAYKSGGKSPSSTSSGGRRGLGSPGTSASSSPAPVSAIGSGKRRRGAAIVASAVATSRASRASRDGKACRA